MSFLQTLSERLFGNPFKGEITVRGPEKPFLKELVKQVTVPTKLAETPQPPGERENFPLPTLDSERIDLGEYLKHQKMGVFTLIARLDTDGTPMVLLAHRTDIDMWNVPGGGVDHPENGIEAEAAREVFEETGLEVDILDKRQFVVNAPVKEGSTSHTMGTNGAWRFDAAMWMIGVIKGGELKLNGEADGLQWVRIDQIPDNTYVRHAEFLSTLLSPDFVTPTQVAREKTPMATALIEAAKHTTQRPAKSIAPLGLEVGQNLG